MVTFTPLLAPEVGQEKTKHFPAAVVEKAAVPLYHGEGRDMMEVSMRGSVKPASCKFPSLQAQFQFPSGSTTGIAVPECGSRGRLRESSMRLCHPSC